jgi:hypothetical protein
MGLVENGTADFEETVEWDNLKVRTIVLFNKILYNLLTEGYKILKNIAFKIILF